MRGNSTWPLAIWLGLTLTPLMVAGGQVLFKFVSRRLPPGGIVNLGSVIFDPYFVAAMIIYSVATVWWIFVLRSVPLSIAYTFTALGFVCVPLISMYLFGEMLTGRFVMGSCLIITGLIVIHA